MRLARYRHLVYAPSFLVFWFFIGGAISMGGSPIEGLIDALGFLFGFLYWCIACVVLLLKPSSPEDWKPLSFKLEEREE
jgi:hypothetical protein